MKKNYVFLMMVIGMFLCSVVPAVALTPDMVIERAVRCLGMERKDIRNLDKNDRIFYEEYPELGTVEMILLNFVDNKVSGAVYFQANKNRSSIIYELDSWKRHLRGSEWKMMDDKPDSKYIAYSNNSKFIVGMFREEEQTPDSLWSIMCFITPPK